MIYRVQMSLCRLASSISQGNLNIQISGPHSGDSLRSSRIGSRKCFKTALWVILMNNRPALGAKGQAFLLLSIPYRVLLSDEQGVDAP